METVLITEIKINNNRRLIDGNKINELASSIKEIGLLNPVTITSDKKLIAGLHRIRAFQLLDKKEIPCNVIDFNNSLYFELAEIDENLIRNELHYTDRGDQFKRRKEIYEELYPETKREATLKQYRNPDSGERIKPSFIEDTAKKTGQSKSKIAEEIQISNKVIPEAKELLKEKDLPKTEAILFSRKPAEEQKKIVDKIASGECKNVNHAILSINQDKPREVKPLPVELFDVIYADPPWRYEHAKTTNDSIEAHYPTMNLEDIKSMKVPSAENSVLLLWTTSPKIEEGLQVLNSWGFSYRSSMIWDKSGIEKGINWIGMGYWFRCQHEILLVGVKGKFSPPKEDCRFPSIYREKNGEHSKKPEFIYEMIEKMFPGHKYIELFAREKRNGWEAWGNEVK